MSVETLLLGTMVLGTATSAFGQAKAGADAKSAAEALAREEERSAAEQARIFAREGRQAIGAQAAAAASAGVKAGEGSPLLLALESAEELERGLAEIRRGGAARAELARFTGRSAQTAGFLGAAGTILGGGAKTFTLGRELERSSRTGWRSPF